MGRRHVLQLIERAERLADNMYTANQAEFTSLSGQALGVAAAIRAEFERYGVDIQNNALDKATDGLKDTPKNMAYLIHVGAGWARAKADELPD